MASVRLRTPLTRLPRRAVAQRIGQLHIVADQLVAFGRDDDDIALGEHRSRLAVPDYLIRSEVIALAVHPYVPACRDDVGITVVSDLVGAEGDDLALRG